MSCAVLGTGSVGWMSVVALSCVFCVLRFVFSLQLRNRPERLKGGHAYLRAPARMRRSMHPSEHSSVVPAGDVVW